MLNETKQEELENIIQKGSIEEIGSIIASDFHSIKYTRSFSLILNRLEKQELAVQDLQRNIKRLFVNYNNPGSYDE